MNQSTFIGNIGKDAEIRNVNNVFAIGFNLAVNETYKDQNGQKIEKTLWVTATIWKNDSKQTGIAQFLKKGTKVLIQGKVEPDVFKNKDGVYMPQLRLRVDRLELLSKKEETLGTETAAGAVNNQPEQPALTLTHAGQSDETDNDLPF
jgi:single-strand DNA-binding protein